MKSSIKVLGAAGLLLCSFAVSAQSTFVVSGPLHSFYDSATNSFHDDYAFSATVTHDPSVPLWYYTTYGSLVEYGYFKEALVSVAYTIYDNTGNPVLSRLFDPGTEGYVIAANSLQSDYPYWDIDYINWYGYQSTSTVYSDLQVGFTDSTAQMVDDATEYPLPPSVGEFDASNFNVRYWSSTGYSFEAYGTIVDVSSDDPIAQCAIQYDNRGQYMKCVTEIIRDYKQSDGLSGAEIGELLKESANP